MEVKTITQGRDGCKVSGAYKLIFPIRKDYYHIRNDGTETAYASVFSDSTDTAEDGVYDTPSGGVLSLKGHGSDTLYVSGKVTVMGTASAVCPFKIGLRGGDGYADVTATGNPVQLDGLQGGVPFSEMVVSGKNLMPFPYYDGDTITSNGVTFTVNADGTVTANGTVSTGKIAYFCISHLANKLIPGTKYTLSGCPEGGGNDKFSLYISERTNDDKSNGKYYLDYGDGITFEMGDYEKYNINIQIRSGVTVDNLVFRPQLELGDTPTEYEPPITGRELTVNVNGSDYTITPDSNPYVIPNDIRQQDGLNTISVSEGEISVVGVRKNAAIKRIWDEIDEIKTAIIVSNGESE